MLPLPPTIRIAQTKKVKITSENVGGEIAPCRCAQIAPATAIRMPPITNACMRNRTVFLPAARAVSSLSRIDRSTRPQGEAAA